MNSWIGESPFLAEDIRDELLQVPIIDKVDALEIENRKIKKIIFSSGNLGSFKLTRLSGESLDNLFEFYFQGLSSESRYLFPPYPLFKPAICSIKELNERFVLWKKESDWFFFILEGDSGIAGASVLKKLNWPDDPDSPNRPPTSGLAVREDCKKKGLGFILMKAVEIQAALCGVKRLFVTVREDNLASLKLHKKCGFIETGKIVPRFVTIEGQEVFGANDIELVLNIEPYN